ncbi:MAG: hypothetical protein ACI4SS_04580 [Clostridia bacterium]
MKKIKRESLREQIKQHKSVFTIYLILRILVIASMVLQFLNGNYENCFLCLLTLLLFTLPGFVEKNYHIQLPNALEIIILFFIFAAEILGEMHSFYIRVPNWDTMLHTINGFLCAAIGFALVDMLNKNSRIKFELSPLFLAVVAFCFSMTVGVLWEFFEFSGDRLLGFDMQKDTVVSSITTVELDPTRSNIPITVKDIADVEIVHSDGTREALGLGGYLDIGIIDTMKDLFVNFIGAVIFSIIGYIYVKTGGKGKIAKHFIPKVQRKEEEET